MGCQPVRKTLQPRVDRARELDAARAAEIGAAGLIERVEVDTCHYKGNYPDRCSLQAALVQSATDQSIITEAIFWPTLMGEQKLKMDNIHKFGASALALSLSDSRRVWSALRAEISGQAVKTTTSATSTTSAFDRSSLPWSMVER